MTRDRDSVKAGIETTIPFAGRGILAAAIALALASAAPVVAQDGNASQAATESRSQQRYQFDIPAMPLPQAIAELSAVTGLQVLYTERSTFKHTAPALRGSYTVSQALQRLLSGTGLTMRFTGANSATIELASQGGVKKLSTVRVSADSLTAGVSTEGSGSLTTAGPVNTATGLPLSLRDTPQSVTVMTRERLDQQNLNTLADVAEQVTGVYYNNKGTSIGGRTLMYSRGYEVDSYQIDGVNVPWEALAESERYGHGSLDTAIYDSVTVVRGSTGLLTGAGDPSALMALTRKKPTQEFRAFVEANAGSWEHYRAMVDVGGPLNGSGSLRGRVVAAYDQGETWVDDYSNERSIFYGVLEADLGQHTLLTLTLEHGTADSEGAPWAEDYGTPLYFAGGVIPIAKDTSTNVAPHWSYLNSDRSYFSMTLDHQFNDAWRARLSYGYGKFNSDMRRGMVNAIPANGALTAARVLSLDYSYDTHIIDAQVNGKFHMFGREHELVAGFNLYRNDQEAPLGVYDVLPAQAFWNDGHLHYGDPDWSALPGSSGDYPFDIDTRQKGVYLATRLRPAERLSVILGGRLTDWEYFYADRATPDHDYYVYSDLDYSNEFTPYAGLVVEVTDNFSGYASYTQIFKPQELRDIEGNLLEPEEGTTYEAGIKGEWFDGRLNASAALFESKRDNIAVALRDENGPILTPKGDPAFRAKDHTKGRGWELEVAGELIEGWRIQAGYTQFRNEDSDGNVLDTAQPEQMLKLYTDYQLMPRLRVGGSLRWQDGTSANPAWIVGDPGRYDIGSYFVLGLNAGYELSEQLSLDLVVNNLLDEEYRVSNYSHSYGAPRHFMLEARYTFY
ncbi:MAG: TonB-dependent siderophore receptor [Porticoccaceae bacterium]